MWASLSTILPGLHHRDAFQQAKPWSRFRRPKFNSGLAVSDRKYRNEGESCQIYDSKHGLNTVEKQLVLFQNKEMGVVWISETCGHKLS